MIVFEGSVSDKCRHYIRKKEAEAGLVGSLVATVTIIVPIIIVLVRVVRVSWKLITFGCIPLALLFVVFSYLIPFSKKNDGMIVPSKVTITDDGMVISQGEKFNLVGSVAGVKMILDMGEWYHISWKRNPGLGRFVCQKNLIATGTIQDFEKLFEGKIVRKNK